MYIYLCHIPIIGTSWKFYRFTNRRTRGELGPEVPCEPVSRQKPPSFTFQIYCAKQYVVVLICKHSCLFALFPEVSGNLLLLQKSHNLKFLQMCFGKLQNKNITLSVDLNDLSLLQNLDKKFLGIKIKPFSSIFRWQEKYYKLRA